jgi:outer membrane receptor protein involved in Fe transport
MNFNSVTRQNIMTAASRMWVSILALAFVLCSVCAFGQTESSQISGTITDTSGAVVKDAKVEAKSVNNGFTRETTTNGAGIYTIPGLKADTYEVTVDLAGFQKTSKKVSLAVGADLDVSLQLTVGAETTVVEVTASNEGNEVNTVNQTLSQTVTSSEIDLLPTSPTRNPYALVGTSGNVAEDSSSNRGAGYAINGMRSASTDILLDGAENVSAFSADVGQVVPLDSVQEFSVLTNGFTAEYGRAAGGVVNLVTKSGTNAFHGSAYEYNRVSALSANTYQNDANNIKKGVFTRNNFGFAVGGPIIKNKLFFFSNTEWIRVRSVAPTTYAILDPASYSALAPASQAYFAAAGKLGTVQTLTSGPCSSNPLIALTCDEISFNAPSDAGGGLPQNTWEEVARVDYNLSDKTTIFGRYASYKELDFAGTVNSSPYTGYNTGQSNYDQNFEFNFSHVFNASLLDTAKIAFNRLNGPVQPLSTAPVQPTLYSSSSLNTLTINSIGNTLIFPGYSQTTPGNSIPFGGPQNIYQFYDDLSYTHGKHQFNFGGQFLQLRDNRIFGAYENPFEYLGKNTIDSGLANLITGNIYQFQGAVYPQGEFPCVNSLTTGLPMQTAACTLTLPVGPPAFNRNYRYNEGAAYAQDTWKLLPRLTIDLGVRWEYYGPQHNANPALDSNFVFGQGATEFDQIRNGSVQLAANGGYFWKPQYKNFGPRVGFAWDVFGDGKTALRGGFGMSFERNFGNVTFNAIQNPPSYAVISLVSQAANGGVGDVPSMPVYTDVAGPLAGTGTKALPVVSQRAIDQKIKTAYAPTWNLSVDHRVGVGVFSVAYAGSHGIHLYDISNINNATDGGEYLGDARFGNRLNTQYSNMNFRSDHGYSHYDALNLKYGATNLFNKGLAITANYTWSHSLDNLSSTFSEGAAGGASGQYQLGYLDAFNPQLNYGNSDFDIRNRLNASLSWETPWLKNSGNAIARQALGGWGLGTIFSIRSGSPFSIYDSTNTNSGGTEPLWIAPSPVPTTGSPSNVGANQFNYIALPSSVQVINGVPTQVVNNTGDSLGIPNCTGLFHVGCTYTTSGLPYPERNQYVGPGYWNIDMNFYKTFKITERFGLQFRAEMYNILNHHNQYINYFNLDAGSIAIPVGGPAPAIQTEKGGIYGSAGQPTDERRNIQFGLKLTF